MTIDGNNADGDDSGASGGGGIFNEGGDITTDADTSITNNEAVAGASGSGGGLLIAGGSYTATGTTITGNLTNRAGGGIEVRNALSDDSPATLVLTDVLLNMNNAGADAPAPGNGGGLHITGPSTTTISGGTANNNSASNEGGALWNGSGVMTIAEFTINENNADFGGGLFNNGGTLNVSTSAIINNEALTTGGGIENIVNAIMTIDRSTISGNISEDNGGGIFNSGTINVQASTVATNEAFGIGGGIFSDGTANLSSSIFALNAATSGTDVSGIITSDNYNLIGTDDAADFTADTDDLVGVDPLLDVLANNGGITLTHALLEGSPAYNAGNPENMDTDQIGQDVFEGRRDIGAFEAQAILSTEDFDSNETLTVYPNPSNGESFVRLLPQFGEKPQIEIIEVGSGRLVRNFTATQSTQPLPLTGLANGLYILRVTTNTKSMSRKLILAR